jgi:hypothetical protein
MIEKTSYDFETKFLQVFSFCSIEVRNKAIELAQSPTTPNTSTVPRSPLQIANSAINATKPAKMPPANAKVPLNDFFFITFNEVLDTTTAPFRSQLGKS